MTKIVGHQLKAARALCGASQREIAAAAGITPPTLSHLETSGPNPVPGYAETLQAVVAALNARGVAFAPNGVFLMHPAKPLGAPLVSPARSAAQVAANPE
jgi:transcriptional regulator with XRE-family HTH domain